MLPLHWAFEPGASDASVQLLLQAFPAAAKEKDSYDNRHGHGSIDFVICLDASFYEQHDLNNSVFTAKFTSAGPSFRFTNLRLISEGNPLQLADIENAHWQVDLEAVSLLNMCQMALTMYHCTVEGGFRVRRGRFVVFQHACPIFISNTRRSN